MFWRGTAAAALLIGGVAFARAAESTEPLALGGLVVTPAAGASLQFDSAEILIDPSNVSAKYRITNPGPDPVAATLAFQVPELDFSDPDTSYAIPASDPRNFAGLSVRIDGKPAAFAFVQSAVLDGKDISGVLRASKLALVPIGTFQNDITAMPPEQRQKLQDMRLIVENGTDPQGNPIFSPSWSVRTQATRKVTLAPNQTLAVDLRYRTSVGYSLDTSLRLPLRNDKALSGLVQMLRSDYCVDDGFYTGLDKIAAMPRAQGAQPSQSSQPTQQVQPPQEPAEANEAKLRERKIVFALQTKVPQGPYKDFRLVVNKGRPDRVVSFCLDNLKRISPTAFEMRATDFQPAGDLKVLLIGRN
jgi:hypothetical protein